MVVPSSWLKEEEGSQFCRWPQNLSKSEAAIAIKRGDRPESDWVEKIVIKVYPQKKQGVSWKKCQTKHNQLYKCGSEGLETEEAEENVDKVNKPFKLPVGYKQKRSEHPISYTTPTEKPRIPSQSDGNGSSRHDEMDISNENYSEPTFNQNLIKNITPSSQNSIDTVSKTTPVAESKSQSSRPSTSKAASCFENLNPDPDHSTSSCSSTSKQIGSIENLPADETESSEEDSSTDNDESMAKNAKAVINELDAETTGTGIVDNFITKKFTTATSSSNESGFMSEYTIRRLFRWMYKTNIRLKELTKSNEELKLLVQGKTPKTAATVIPDLCLPCSNPDEIKYLDSKLHDKQVFADLVTLMSTQAAGTSALHIGYTLMSLIMTPYCAGYYTWDGLHKSTRKLSIKSHDKLHKALEGAMGALTVKNHAGTITVSSDDIKKKAGRWLTTFETRLKPEEQKPALPWVFK